MKLSELGLLKATMIAFVGELTQTSVLSSEGEPYYLGKLLTPITVRCSTDKTIDPIEEVDELYIRQHDAEGDSWKLVDEADPKKGFSIPGFKTDFSKSQEICLYQETTILEWTKGNRKEQREEKDMSIRQRLEARAAARAAAQADVAKEEPANNGKGRRKANS